MSIALYDWQSTPQRTKDRLLLRAGANVHTAMDEAAAIVADVKARGDAALFHYAQKFDGARLDVLRVTEAEFDAAEDALPEDLKAAIRVCAANVSYFHTQQMARVETHWMVEVMGGVWAGEQVSPINSVGLYVPRGKGSFPSVSYMLAIPAVIAKVPRIVMVTPPMACGGADAATLFTARLCGVKEVYKVGGAQAIAALAYGTQSIPMVAKIVGPGNAWVTAARRLVAYAVDVGMPAGPTDSLILTDGDADVEQTAWDMLNEAEHGRDSASLLVTNDKNFAYTMQTVLPNIIAMLPEPQRSICAYVMSKEGYGGIVLTCDLEESVAFANTYAPEHMMIKTRKDICSEIHTAGEILIGSHTPFAMGNYGVGVNNVLPTGGAARSYSATTIWDFLRRTSLAHMDRRGFAALKDSVAFLANYEGFPAHMGAIMNRE